MDDMQSMSRLHELAMHSAVGLDAVLDEACEIAVELSEADFGTVQLAGDKVSDLRIAAQRGFPSWWVDFSNGAGRASGSAARAWQTRQRVIVENVEADALTAGDPSLQMQLRAGVRAVQSTPLLTRTGKVVGVLSTYFARPHRPDGRVLRWLDLLARQVADLIDHAQITSDLRNSELRCRALVMATSDVVYSMSPDWRCMRFLDGKGFIPDTPEVSDDWLTQYIDEEDRPRVLEAIRRAIETKSVFDLEHRVRRVDGSLGWTHSRAVPLLDAEGEIAEWFGAASDVTGAKLAEAELFDERQRLQALLEALPVGVAFTDSIDCQHVTGNAALLAQFSASASDNVSASSRDSLGSKVTYTRDGKVIGPEELPLQRAACTGLPVKPEELQVRLPGGREFSIEVCGAPIRNSGGKVIGAVTVSMDITDRKRAAEAAEQGRLKDEFLALLGHELRNPLSAISSAVELLRRGVTQPQRELTDQLVRNQVDILKRLVDDLLEISRFALGSTRLHLEPVLLSELLTLGASAARAALHARSQRLVVHAPASAVCFMADKVRLQQIIANLLDNASKYSGAGERIELSGALERSEVVLRCKDHGRGIAPELRARIFEPLVRLEPARRDAPGGLGLGLTLVQRLAQAHGGRVSVESVPEAAGCEFVVRIPFVKATLPSEDPLRSSGPDAGSGALLVFLVEDNPDVAQILALAMQQAGHRVECFEDGASALAGMGSVVPGAVVLDTGLPGMSGFELLAHLRADPRLRDTLIIGISGRAHEPVRGDAARFDHFLLKPIDVRQMMRLLGQGVKRADVEEAGAP